MPKRKSNTEEYEHLLRKTRRLEKRIAKEKEKMDSPRDNSECRPEIELQDESPPSVVPEDWLWPATDQTDQPVQTTSNSELRQEVVEITDIPSPLDEDILEILGDEPPKDSIKGPEIREEIACRLQHICVHGLKKEERKNLIEKYNIPSNCLLIDAPKINQELKAVINENNLKRDKGIELKQKQLASALSCLSGIISDHLKANQNNPELLRKLMDTARILSDIQHADSITRRNFVLFGVKKELRPHVSSTKIDQYLFSSELSDTIKTAKAVNKSGTDLRATVKPSHSQPSTSRAFNLNSRAPPQVTRRATTTGTFRSRDPPIVARQTQQAHSRALNSLPRQRQAPPPPPPPPPTQQRHRRY